MYGEYTWRKKMKMEEKAWGFLSATFASVLSISVIALGVALLALIGKLLVNLYLGHGGV